jgi:nuclear pore complex protein Nup107
VSTVLIAFRSYTHSPRSFFASNLKHALLLANDVADARYKLYEDFTHEDGSKPRLRDYLGAVRQAVVAGLEGGGGDPWRVVGI